MRLAIIGCGSIGMRHLKNALALGCEVFVHDVDETRMDAAVTLGAHRWGMEINARVGVFACEHSVDAMLIATPYDQHLDLAMVAAMTRVPLFVEKPLGSIDQIEDWRRLAKASESQITQVGYQLRFHETARWLMRSMPHPDRGEFLVNCDMRLWPGKAYGPMMLECSHELDLALACGAPSEVIYSRTDDGGAHPQDYPIHLNRVYMHLGSARKWSVELAGAYSGHYTRKWLLTQGLTNERYVGAWFHSPEELGDQMYVDELKHFLECVQQQKQTDVPLADGLRVLEVCKQVEEMARQRA